MRTDPLSPRMMTFKSVRRREGIFSWLDLTRRDWVQRTPRVCLSVCGVRSRDSWQFQTFLVEKKMIAQLLYSNCIEMDYTRAGALNSQLTFLRLSGSGWPEFGFSPYSNLEILFSSLKSWFQISIWTINFKNLNFSKGIIWDFQYF